MCPTTDPLILLFQRRPLVILGRGRRRGRVPVRGAAAARVPLRQPVPRGTQELQPPAAALPAPRLHLRPLGRGHEPRRHRLPAPRAEQRDAHVGATPVEHAQR